ncbi:MAG: protein BatD [Paludibacter sp.]|nr:protein BatD [Paludibacter sp.]
MRRRFIILSFLLLALNTWLLRAAEPVRFTAQAPSAVAMDNPFQLVYSVNASGKDLRVPEITNFEVLAGPFESHSSSYQVINGRQTSSVSISYTYTLQAKKTGTFVIPAASMLVDNKRVTSNAVAIKVLPADANTNSGKSQSSSSSKGQSISNENIFVRVILSKPSVYEQEAVLVTYKLYTTLDVIQCPPTKFPDFNGFMKQEIDQPKNSQFTLENYNGKNYPTVVLFQYLLYPQKSGVITIDKAEFEAVIQMRNRAAARSIFDDFFESTTNVSKKIYAPATKINVSALPANKPTSFSGTVGRFSIDSKISTTRIKANEAVTLRIGIAGAGNMKLIKNPEIKFPDGFELYDPKVTNNFKTTNSGVSGSKTIEFMFIPRHSGNYEIPSAEFSYFDVNERTYKILRTPVYKLEVLKGSGAENQTVVGNYVDKEDVKQLGKDIRYIQTEDIELSKEETPIYGSLTCWLMYLLPLLISLVLFIFFRKKALENADLDLVKNKKANKIAQKRLKLAQRLLKEGKKDSFYEEILKAVWDYLSDKLSIPVALLTKEKVADELSKRAVEAPLLNQLNQILSTCEFARYAPNSGQQEMGNLYDDSIRVISELEEVIKKS